MKQLGWPGEALRRLARVVTVACVLAGVATAGAARQVRCVAGKGDYAVVVSRATYDAGPWRQVVEALRAKHQASVIVYPYSVWEARAALVDVFPRYACFVARPTEAGRRFVVNVHRMTRTLDADPYTDVLWGIVTGYEAKDALRIATHSEPLVVRKGAAGTGLDLGVFDAGRVFSEGEKGAMWEKVPGGKAVKKAVPQDTTKLLVETFNTFHPDLFVTSGHATPRDWQIGYSYKNGQFRCKGGQLFGLDLKKRVHPIHSPNPKVYLPAGNCLMGHIPDRECMALAFMRTGGVMQMYGYTVLTWFGYGGWGVRDLFVAQPGRYTLAEAFYANGQCLIHRLETRFPKKARVNFENYDLYHDRKLLGKLAAKHGVRGKEALGLLWDRDTVAFYGDPAWEARVAPRPLAWTQRLTAKGGVYTFEVVADRDTGRPRPPVALLPHRVANVEFLEGGELSPVVTDNFVLLPKPAKFEKGKSYKVVFRATRCAARSSETRQ